MPLLEHWSGFGQQGIGVSAIGICALGFSIYLFQYKKYTIIQVESDINILELVE